MNVTFEEFAEFIRAQPDERPVNMNESESHNNCGCLLIQFARFKNFCPYRPYAAGTESVIVEPYNANINITLNIQGACYKYIHDAVCKKIETYAEAKELLNGH